MRSLCSEWITKVHFVKFIIGELIKLGVYQITQYITLYWHTRVCLLWYLLNMIVLFMHPVWKETIWFFTDTGQRHLLTLFAWISRQLNFASSQEQQKFCLSSMQSGILPLLFLILPNNTKEQNWQLIIFTFNSCIHLFLKGTNVSFPSIVSKQ